MLQIQSYLLFSRSNKLKTLDLVWTVGDTRSMKEINIDGHKVLVLVVPKFHLTSEISVLTFDPTKGILCEKVVIDV